MAKLRESRILGKSKRLSVVAAYEDSATDARVNDFCQRLTSYLGAGSLLANLHGIAQLWTWGSLQLTTGADDFVPLLRTALDAHLGPEDR